MTAEKTKHGYIVVSDIVDNVLVKRIYMGHSIKEAKRRFKNDPVTKKELAANAHYNKG